jgi:hypothetical protein
VQRVLRELRDQLAELVERLADAARLQMASPSRQSCTSAGLYVALPESKRSRASTEPSSVTLYCAVSDAGPNCHSASSGGLCAA